MSSKNTWASNIGYIWAMIGSAVGFGPILSFSAGMAYCSILRSYFVRS